MTLKGKIKSLAFHVAVFHKSRMIMIRYDFLEIMQVILSKHIPTWSQFHLLAHVVKSRQLRANLTQKG